MTTVTQSLSPIYNYDANLIECFPYEIHGQIINCLINEDHSHLLIPSISLTCRKWCRIINDNPCISLINVLFKIKDSTDVWLSEIPRDHKDPKKQGFTLQEFTLLDRVYNLYPKSFRILLNYPSDLFGENSFYLPLLHRYKWKKHYVQDSQNKNIQSIIRKQTSILENFIDLVLKEKKNKECFLFNQDKKEMSIKQVSLWNGVEENLKGLYQGFYDPSIHSFFMDFQLIAPFENVKIKGLLLKLFMHHNIPLTYLVEHFPKDREIVLAAVKEDGEAIQYADESFLDDREIVLAAVNQKISAFQYVNESLKSDEEFILDIVSQCNHVLQYANENLKSDREFILNAIQRDGYSLQYAEESLRKDREIVMAAVQRKGCALQYADESLQKDREIVFNAAKQDIYALQWAEESLQKDKKFVLAIGFPPSPSKSPLKRKRDVFEAKSNEQKEEMETNDDLQTEQEKDLERSNKRAATDKKRNLSFD